MEDVEYGGNTMFQSSEEQSSTSNTTPIESKADDLLEYRYNKVKCCDAECFNWW
jgi:hypothetical protein